jgi:glycosyltransferase involved in cell wall biosynthesis
MQDSMVQQSFPSKDRSGSLVSIIVPIYNAERYLPHCLDSVTQQSYKNLQILLVDDGSTDGSPEICDEYAERDRRIHVLHRQNGGIAAAQNTGLDAAHGEFIAFCDDDDIMHSKNIEILLNAIRQTGADMAKGRWSQMGISALPQTIIKSSQQTDEPRLTIIEEPLKSYQKVFCKTFRIIGGPGAEANYFNESNWCRLYKRELWDGLRFATGHYAQDIRMAGPLYSRMKRVVDVDQVLYFWLQEPDSVTHSKRDSVFWHDNVAAAAENFSFTLERGIIPYRNYFGLTSSVRDEKRGMKAEQRRGKLHEEDRRRCMADSATMTELIRKLSIIDRCFCTMLAQVRRVENLIYDKKIHSMK